jgi:hypothetical protein
MSIKLGCGTLTYTDTQGEVREIAYKNMRLFYGERPQSPMEEMILPQMTFTAKMDISGMDRASLERWFDEPRFVQFFRDLKWLWLKGWNGLKDLVIAFAATAAAGWFLLTNPDEGW